MGKYTSKIITAFDELPKGGKFLAVLLATGVVVGVGYVGYEIVKSINNAKAKLAAEAATKQAVSDLANLNAQVINQSFSQTEYDQWAKSIATQFASCDGSHSAAIASWCDFTTTASCYTNAGAVVFNIIKQFQNDADFLALVTAFGTQTIPKPWPCSWTDGSSFVNVGLVAAVTSQLNSDEIDGLNATLVGNGVITYKF